MKNKIVSIGICLLAILFFTACASVPQAVAGVNAEPAPTSTPAPVSFADLLDDALRHYEAGDYEETILAYTMALEIEPRNFDAQFGLGKAYRAAKQTEKAIVALEAARILREGDRSVLLELGNAYLTAGEYKEAESIARPLWESNTSDMEAGMLLLLGMAAQEQIEDILALLENEKLATYLAAVKDEDCIYIGKLNADGQREGKGTGVYAGGFVYSGEYCHDKREGQGIWYYPAGGRYYIGSWANDTPNGYGEYHFTANNWKRTGEYINGLEHGARRAESDGQLFLYTADNGSVPVLETTTEEDGTLYVFAYDQNEDGQLAENRLSLWGIEPWGE